MKFSPVIVNFVRESNHIEGIDRDPTEVELEETLKFLKLDVPTVGTLSQFVRKKTGRELRSKKGMNVFVGNFHPPQGGPHIVDELNEITKMAFENSETPFDVHRKYETLHPFMDGNGRSGRLLWAWQMLEHDYQGGLSIGFLHMWYYQSLSAASDRVNLKPRDDEDGKT